MNRSLGPRRGARRADGPAGLTVRRASAAGYDSASDGARAGTRVASGDAHCPEAGVTLGVGSGLFSGTLGTWVTWLGCTMWSWLIASPTIRVGVSS